MTNHEIYQEGIEKAHVLISNTIEEFKLLPQKSISDLFILKSIRPIANGIAYEPINLTLPPFQIDDKFGSENKAKIVIQQSKLIKIKEILTIDILH